MRWGDRQQATFEPFHGEKRDIEFWPIQERTVGARDYAEIEKRRAEVELERREREEAEKRAREEKKLAEAAEAKEKEAAQPKNEYDDYLL